MGAVAQSQRWDDAPEPGKHDGVTRDTGRVELAEQVGRRGDVLAPPGGKVERVGEERECARGRLITVGECRPSVALGESRAARREHERNMGVRRDGQTEEPAEHDLPRRRAHEIRSADDLADTLLGIVDDDGELVGGHAVGAADDEVVDDAAAAAEEAILELDALVVGAEAQCVRPSAVDPFAGRCAADSSRHVPG